MKDTVKVSNIQSSNEQRTQLLNGHSAPTEFYKEVYQNMGTRVTGIEPGKLYTTKDIAGEYWDSLPTNSWKRLAGRCFAHMVSNRFIHLKFVQYKKSCTKHYKKI